ncbi:MAG: hypothetical protein HN790_04990 [Methylococcales bacterium]|jgi:hypothetical protein|nr:hypothetical protein [Methylococcales bacterium]
MNLQQANKMSTQEISEFSAKEIMTLQTSAAESLQQAKRINDRIHDALELKYKDLASVSRIHAGKESGSVNFEDGQIQVSADLPKRVTWDQKQLAELSKRIQESGEDPLQYMDIAYKVPERKFTAWPDTIKSAFQDARTLKMGRQSFKLTQGDEQ